MNDNDALNNDALNRMTLVKQGTATIASYGYDALSRRTSTTTGNGIVTTYGYTHNDDLSTLVHDFGGGATGFVGGYITNLAAELAATIALDGLFRGLAAEAGTVVRNVVSRSGPKGVDPLHHSANVTIRDAAGSITKHERVVSGNMTASEKALGFPKGSLASHTEARAVTSNKLSSGESMIITGQRAPCPSCKGAMNRAAEESGATIKYQWRQDGATQSWTAGK